ncbi:AAA family ATPase [Archangium violaceum]|uniref:AAA family ATPase n=1 Tax=Archangium violaceum TaxID=83451 RepID=UPI0036DBFBF0
MASDIIDFQLERGRQEELIGREEVMAELDALLLGGPSRGWVLVKGGPGMGKSALLAEWLKWREGAGLPVPPHHFLRRGVEDWDRPEVVKCNLAAQVERLYPELVDSNARPESRLRELLQRVSDKELKPRSELLVLVVDGLDEVEGAPDGSNPLPRFLPHELPPGVKVLCASRPTYPYLSWLEAQAGLRTIDLDGERWAGTNRNVVRQYWEYVAPRFVPPLTPAFVREVVQRAEGNVLYAVKLEEWLRGQPEEKRRVELLPRGLEALLEENWARIQALPDELGGLVREGLGLVAVAREALPLPVLAAVAHWKDSDGERFLRVARSFLLEEPAHEGREKAWRPFHESFRGFILSKLGSEREREKHQRLAEQLCRWPVETPGRGFRWSYALRHGVTHWLKAGRWEQARGLYTNLGYLEEKCRVAGVLSLEDALMSAAAEGPGAVTPDGRRVVSASEDRTLKVWEVETGRCLHTLHGVGAFHSVACTSQVICAGDVLGNVWILEMESGVPGVNPAPTNTPSPGLRMNISFPKPVLEAYRSNALALFIGSGLSLGRDVKGNFPTWSQLPHRLLDVCERLDSLDAQVIQARRGLFTGRMRLELMLADLGSLRAALDRDYQEALNDIFRPSDAAPGAAHQAVARLGGPRDPDHELRLAPRTVPGGAAQAGLYVEGVGPGAQ